MTNSRPKLLYVCGMGHCGSTILDLALGMSPQISSVAQLSDLFLSYDPWKPKSDEPSERDLFWQRVISRLSQEDVQEIEQLNQSASKEQALFSLFFSEKRRKRFSAVQGRLIEAIMAEAGTHVVVDSSKNIARCIGLSQCRSVDVYVLHLVRDVRGLVNSTNKRAAEHGRAKRYLGPTAHWAMKNAAGSLLVPRRTARYLAMRYEDLVDRPAAAVDRIARFLDEDLLETRRALQGETDIDPNRSFGFGGNRVLHHRQKLRFRTGQRDSGGVFESPVYWWTLGWISSFWGYRANSTPGNRDSLVS
jgi:hypothetical protein